ncbi:MAG TPA: DUF2927 domain-containing protein [Paracoccaceae bacterium]|nr:DUF2927 domain-containing protein [Paracoccaceae bacterium]
MPARRAPSAPVRAITALALAGVLSACALTAPGPAPRPAPSGAPRAEPPSAASLALAGYYRDLQAGLLDRGLLRTDPGIPDAPFNARMLTETFVRVALYDEFQRGPGGYVARETPSILRRWEGPVRLSLRFGASVPESRRATERARVASLLARLSRVTGHPIRLQDSGANFFLYIVNEDERRALGPEIAAAMPGFGAAEINAFTRMPPATYCQVSAMSRADSGVYTRALAVTRAEHPDLLHLSCLHEEIVQGLGLPNDWARARPSVFNDDQEFALLTPLDEAMLRLLYDPALRPGMTEAEARPIVESLAKALMGGES